MSSSTAAFALARRLQPLARPVGPWSSARPCDQIELRFQAAALDADTRAALERCARASAPDSTPDWQRGRALCARELLERVPPGPPALELLRAAARAACAPRPRPRLMAVLNVTPDSFSDGGRTLDPRAALDHALALEAQGADLLDVGGQSTRPNAPSVPVEEELRRVGPVLQALAGRLRIPLSIDTSHAAVARLALDQGASVVNDVTAGREDPRLWPLVAERRAGLVLMHMRGTPADMQRDPRYADVTAEVAALLRERLELALELGIERTRIWLDPGIGFGKTLEHNLTLLEELGLLRSLGQDVLVGPSRKSFIGAVARAFGREEHGAPIRAGGTAAAVAACVNAGAAWLRVHDAATMADAARVAWSIAEAAR